MKKLLVIVFVAIIAAGVASPVYAQEGYPVDEPKCSDVYWMGISDKTCVTYYESNYPEVATGCGELEAFACVEYYEGMIYDDVVETTYVNLAESADSTPDIAAGGEGPIIVWSMTDVIGLAFGGLLLTVALIVIVGNAISKWAKNKRK